MSRSRGRAGRVAIVSLVAAGLAALLVLAGLALLRSPEPADAPVASGPRATNGPGPASAPEARPAEAAPEDVPHTELPLRLVATVVRESRRLSLATIEYTEAEGHEVMSEGQVFRSLPSVQLASIERGRVLIDNEGRREQLVIDRAVRAPNPNLPSPEVVAGRRDLSRRLRALTDAGTNYREVLGRGRRGGLLGEGEVSPVYEGGELIGVQLDAVRDGGVYDQVGLRNGDVVTAINGVSLGEPTAAAEVLAELALSEVIEVDVERSDGTVELLSVPTAELTAAVEDLP